MSWANTRQVPYVRNVKDLYEARGMGMNYIKLFTEPRFDTGFTVYYENDRKATFFRKVWLGDRMSVKIESIIRGIRTLPNHDNIYTFSVNRGMQQEDKRPIMAIAHKAVEEFNSMLLMYTPAGCIKCPHSSMLVAGNKTHLYCNTYEKRCSSKSMDCEDKYSLEYALKHGGFNAKA